MTKKKIEQKTEINGFDKNDPITNLHLVKKTTPLVLATSPRLGKDSKTSNIMNSSKVQNTSIFAKMTKNSSGLKNQSMMI